MRLNGLLTGAFFAAALTAPAEAQSTAAAPKQAAQKAAPAKSPATNSAATHAPAVASKSIAAKKTTPAQPTIAKTTTAKTTPAKSTPAKTAPTKTAAAKAAPPPRHVYQQQPTTDRYRDIQRALADQGFFKGAIDGAWGPDSTEALKHFQREQKLDDDGKISSLSIIALGLGPRREVASSAVVSSAPAPNLPAAPASPPAESARTAAGP